MEDLPSWVKWLLSASMGAIGGVWVAARKLGQIEESIRDNKEGVDHAHRRIDQHRNDDEKRHADLKEFIGGKFADVTRRIERVETHMMEKHRDGHG